MKNTAIGLVAMRTQATEVSRGNWSKPGVAGSDIHAGNETPSGPDGSNNHWTHGAISPVTTNAKPSVPISARARNTRGIVSSLPAALAVAGWPAVTLGG